MTCQICQGPGDGEARRRRKEGPGDSQPLCITVLEPTGSDGGERSVPVQVLLGGLSPPFVTLISYTLLPLFFPPVQAALDEGRRVTVLAQVSLGDGEGGYRGLVLAIESAVRVVSLGGSGGLLRCVGHGWEWTVDN